MLAAGLAAVAAALLILTLAVLPAGRGRVPLSRLDPSFAPPTSTLAGAGAAAGAAVEKVLVKRGSAGRRRGRAGAGRHDDEPAGLRPRRRPADPRRGCRGSRCWAGLLLGLLAAVAVPLGAKLFVRFKTSRRQSAFADQLDDSLQLMASSLRAGHSIMRAMDAVSQEAASPTSEEFARLVNETRVGRDLAEALDEIAERTASDDFAWVAQAIAIHREVGGNLAEVLDAVGHTIRERNAIRRQVKALSAEGKLSAIVLMALPFGIVAFISMTNPSYLAGFTESARRLRDARGRGRHDDRGRPLAQEHREDQVLTMVNPIALAGALAMTSSVVLLGWALLSRPPAAAAQARDNLVRGIDLRTGEPPPSRRGLRRAGPRPDAVRHRRPARPAGRHRRPARRVAGAQAGRRQAGARG